MRAVLGLGASYVPVPRDGAGRRNRRALDLARPAAIIVAGSNGVMDDATVASMTGVVEVDGRSATFAPRRNDVPAWLDCSEAVGTGLQEAYVLFTSGSTGMPKGVSITHANALAFVDWAADEFQVADGSRLASCTPWSFDLSVFDIFGSQLFGGTMLPFSTMSPAGLRAAAAIVREGGASHWLTVPAVASALLRARAIATGDFPALREWMWCGERMPVPVLRDLMERLPHVRFTNLYGPTETTTASTFFRVEKTPAPQDDIPIGQGLWPGTVEVLDELGVPTQTGAEGEIWITGPGVSGGYLNSDGAPVPFVNGDPDWPWHRTCYATGDLGWRDDANTLHFIGRKDSQLKIGGVRVEAGEIEAALVALADVLEAAVFMRTVTPGQDAELCAAIVTRLKASELHQLHEALADLLPRPLHPSRWITMPQLPLTPHGKVDRLALQRLKPWPAQT